MKRLAPLAIALALLAACVPLPPAPPQPQLPLPQPFVSPLQRTLLPHLVAQPWVKKGVGVSKVDGTCPKVGAGWYYDWSTTPSACPDLVEIPMVWCGAAEVLPVGVRRALFGNEPDRAGQCNLAPETYAAVFHELVRRYPHVEWIGPAVSQDGWAWLQAWHAAYTRMYGERPPLHALAVHCYMDAAACQGWIQRNMELAREWTATGRVWVTEFGMLPCWWPELGLVAAQERARSEATKLIDWMEAQPSVAGYAWYVSHIRNDDPNAFKPASCNTSLLDEAGRLTGFGSWYEGQ